MQVPRIPSFFKTPKSKIFDYRPRYYDKRKEQLEQLNKESGKQRRLFFSKKLRQNTKGKRTKNLLFIIIGLFLLFYLLLT